MTLDFEFAETNAPAVKDNRQARVLSHPTGGVEVMGVAPGDIVTPSYNCGPYIVHTSELYWVNYSLCGYLNVAYDSMLSLVCQDKSEAYFNPVWRNPEGRYLYDFKWTPDGFTPYELFVERRGTRSLVLEEPVPIACSQRYPFAPGVDYGAGRGRVWQCVRPCRGFDFNTEEAYEFTWDWQKGCRPACPQCGRSEIHQFEMVILHGLNAKETRQ